MGTHYLLESVTGGGAPDGYQLEDGSGVLLDESAVIDTTHVLRPPLYTPRYPIVWYQDWRQNLLLGTLAPRAPPFAQRDWPLSFAPVPASNLRVWTQSYNLNLIGKDRLPTGAEITDLAPRAYEHHVQLRSWAWSYNLNLIGKDRFPPGAVIYDLPPRAPLQPAQSWTWNYNLNLIAKDRLPTGGIIYDLPRQPDYPVQLRGWLQSPQPTAVAAVIAPFNQYYWPLTAAPLQPAPSWTWQYNLNLIAKDRLPVGAELTDLTPRGYEYPVQLRTWLGAIPRVVVVVTLPPGEIITDRPAPLLVDRAPPTDQQNLLTSTLFTPPPPADTTHVLRAPLYTNPRGPQYSAVHLRAAFGGFPPEVAVVLPFAQFDWPITPPPSWHIQLRTWLQSPRPTPVFKPFAQYDWPLSFGPRQPAQSFTASYNLNLIGKDRLPVGEISTDLPPPIAPAIFQTWIQSVNLALTVTPPVFPIGKRATDLPAQPPRADLGFTESFNLNLIGKDQLPFRQTDWPLPTPPADGRTWIQSVSLALTVTPAVKPFNQTDWPLTPAARQSAFGFTASYNLSLIGRDQLPVGVTIDELPPRAAAGLFQAWIQAVNVALAPPAVLPFNQYTWPLTAAPRQPAQSFTASYNLNLIAKDRLPPGVRITDLPPKAPSIIGGGYIFYPFTIPQPTPPPSDVRHDMPFFATMGQLKSW